MNSTSTVVSMLLASFPEIIGFAGLFTGICGALLLDMKNRFSPWAWPVWIVLNLAWIFWAISTNDDGALTRGQWDFMVVNCCFAMMVPLARLVRKR